MASSSSPVDAMETDNVVDDIHQVIGIRSPEEDNDSGGKQGVSDGRPSGQDEIRTSDEDVSRSELENLASDTRNANDIRPSEQSNVTDGRPEVDNAEQSEQGRVADGRPEANNAAQSGQGGVADVSPEVDNTEQSEQGGVAGGSPIADNAEQSEQGGVADSPQVDNAEQSEQGGVADGGPEVDNAEQSEQSVMNNVDNSQKENGENKADEKEKDESDRKNEKPKPYIGLITNKQSLVSAVASKDMDLLQTLLNKLKLVKEKQMAEEVVEPKNEEREEKENKGNAEKEEGGKIAAHETGATPSTSDKDNTGKAGESVPQPGGKTESEINRESDANHRIEQTDKMTDAGTSKAGDEGSAATDVKSTEKPEENGDQTDKKEPQVPDDVIFPKLSPKTEISHALMMAITTKQAGMIDRLLVDGTEFGVDMHIVDSWCPLICTTAELGDIESFKVMVKHCKNLAISGHYGNILHSAVRSGNYELVQFTLTLKEVDVKHTSAVQGSTALLDAVRCVRLLSTAAETKQNNCEQQKQPSGEKMDTSSDEKPDQTRGEPTANDKGEGELNKPLKDEIKSCCLQKLKSYDLRIIQALIAHGCDVNARDDSRRSALHYASMLGYKQVIEYLLEIGAEKYSEDSSYRDPFMYALFFSHSHLYSLLCDIENINKNLPYFSSYLHFAAKECGPQACEYLLEQGADRCQKNNNGQMPLITAILAKNIAAMEILAKVPPSEFEYQDIHGRPTFHHAISEFRSTENPGQMADILLRLGANIDVMDQSGRTALLRYIEDNEIVEWLLERGANPDYVSVYGLYPLLAACDIGYRTDIVKLLLRYHVDITATQRTCSLSEFLNNAEHMHLTPLQIAIHDQDYQLTLLLLSADVCLNKVHDWLNEKLNSGGLTDDDENWSAIYAYIQQKSHQPMGLKGISRLKILKLLGHKSVKEKIEALCLPIIVQNYLLWQSYIEDRKCIIEQFLSDYKPGSS